ncbi:MAG: FecR domain-containing protein, partial [Alphaproteobacteria bacterium]
MAKLAIVSPSLPRAALAGAAALMLLCSPMMIGAAAAKIGVTSATDGEPLGKPPTEAERVLRVGVDVQANEVITTKAGDRAHLMFLDGTSLTVGPDASLVIDKFVYDPNSKTGDLAITASKGVFRLVGGKISKTNAIVVNTPSDTIGIRGGIAMLDVNQTKTRSIFIFGFSMTIGANGRIET